LVASPWAAVPGGRVARQPSALDLPYYTHAAVSMERL
jgi:hypothetical protein